MISWIFFFISAALLCMALFGSAVVGQFIDDPGNAMRIQIFIGALSVVVGIAGWFGRGKDSSGAEQQINIKGGVRQNGTNNNMIIGNHIDTHNQKNAGQK